MTGKSTSRLTKALRAIQATISPRPLEHALESDERNSIDAALHTHIDYKSDRQKSAVRT